MPALPDRPCMRQLRHQAKDLLKALRVDAPGARLRLEACWEESRGSPPTQLRLTDAQCVIAREYGFESWTRLKQHVETRAQEAQGVAAPTGSEEGTNSMSQDAFPAELGWRWHMAPTECDGRDTVVSTCEGVVVHVLAGQMWPRDGSDAPPLSVYIAQGGGEDDPRRELRAVFYGRDGERHVLPRTHGRGGGWTGYRMFEMPPEVLPLVDVAFVGVEVRTAVERAAE